MKPKAPVKARNWTAVAAWNRNGGPMRDRRAPRGGARNEHAEYMDEVACEGCGNTAITISREFSTDTVTQDPAREISGSPLFLCDICHSARS